MKYDREPFSQADHDDALKTGIVAIVPVLFVVLVCVAICAYIFLHVLPMLFDAAVFALESIWFLAFQLFG
jgi:hypothetical protein